MKDQEEAGSGQDGGYHCLLTLERWRHGTIQGFRVVSAAPPGCAQTSPAEGAAEGAAVGAASRLPPWHPGKALTWGKEGEVGISWL